MNAEYHRMWYFTIRDHEFMRKAAAGRLLNWATCSVTESAHDLQEIQVWRKATVQHTAAYI